MRPLPILLTRPLEASERLAIRLRAMGASRVEISPLLRIVRDGVLPTGLRGVLLTSGQAVEAFVALNGPRGLPAWVVGPRTANLARVAGFDVRGVTADVARLPGIVPQDAPPLVHLRGSERRGDPVAALLTRGIAATEAVLYRQESLGLGSGARDLMVAGPVVVPLYSPRSAGLFARACPATVLAHLRIVAMSPAVAAAAPVSPAVVADRPDGEAMVRAIATISGLSAVEGRRGTV